MEEIITYNQRSAYLLLVALLHLQVGDEVYVLF